MELFRSVNVDWLGIEVVFPWLFLDLQRGRHRFDGLCTGRTSAARFRWAWTSAAARRCRCSSTQPPDIDAIRQAMDAAGIRDASIQNYSERRSAVEQRSADQPAGADQRDRARHGPQADRERAAGPLRQSLRPSAECAGGGSDGGPAAGEAGRRWPRSIRCWACWSISGSASS